MYGTHSYLARPKLTDGRYGRLHDVEPQEGLEMMPPVTLSRLVASKAMRTVPYPARGPSREAGACEGWCPLEAARAVH